MPESTNPRERVGNNSKAEEQTHVFAKSKLKEYIARIEKLEDEKSLTAQDIAEVYAEAKSNGFNAKAIRRIVALRKIDAETRREQAEILEVYADALGMLGGVFA